jgi:hypothetical protein
MKFLKKVTMILNLLMIDILSLIFKRELVLFTINYLSQIAKKKRYNINIIKNILVKK